jgi:hypothetical protein
MDLVGDCAGASEAVMKKTCETVTFKRRPRNELSCVHAGPIGELRNLRLVLLVVLLCTLRAWGQNNHRNGELSVLLKTGVDRASGYVDGFNPVSFSTAPLSEAQFEPITGLDNKDAVPFLIEVLAREPNEGASTLKYGRGSYFYNARCYAALCLGVIGDKRAFKPLVDVINRSAASEKAIENQPDYHIRRTGLLDYAILSLGFLGDPCGVDPILRVLPSLGRQYDFAAYALASIGDPRSAVPLIQHVSKVGSLDHRMHRCLEDLTHSRFPYGFGKDGDKTFRFSGVPELGDLPVENALLTFWQHWSRKGGKFARERAAKTYAEWKRLREQGWKNFSGASKDELFAEMTCGGVASLPYIMEQVEKGDDSLVPYISQFVRPIRRKQPESGPGLLKTATRSQCIRWWRDNHGKYEIRFQTDSGPATKTGLPPENRTRGNERVSDNRNRVLS